MTVKPRAPSPLPDELYQLLKRMRLPYIRRAAPEVIAIATAQRWEHAEVLRVLLAEEVKGREQATIRTRRRASGLPAGKTFDAWEPDRSAIATKTQRALQTLEWIDRAEVLVICGPTGAERLARARSQRLAGRERVPVPVASIAKDTCAEVCDGSDWRRWRQSSGCPDRCRG